MTLHVVATRVGGPEVLELVDRPDREPGVGEIQVDVRAVGVNPVDFKRYGGTYAPADFPLTLGSEAAGAVRAVGPDAVGPRGPVSVGDEVILFRIDDAYSERVTVPASAAVPKPPGMPWPEASGLMLTGATAVHGLAAVDAGPGDTVLFHNASGGVGIMAVQIGVGRGVRMIGTASEANHEFLRSLGAEPVAYGPGLLDRVRAIAPGGVDAAIDGIGTPEALDVSQALVANPARFVTIVATPAAFEAGIKVLGGAPGADPGTEIRMAARLELVDLVAAGKLEVFVERMFPLQDVADAHREVAAGHVRGKLALIP
ncbi:MAG: putative oxidoreductase [Actinomycetia bacterium]|nr:putative oxidoreductase [Actinomycetes bacterium]